MISVGWGYVSCVFAKYFIFLSIYLGQQLMLEDFKEVRAKIPNIFLPLMGPHLQRVSCHQGLCET